ncbi:MAG: SMC-Scp complex subunit ScpB [Promethearchaeota archaeon]
MAPDEQDENISINQDENEASQENALDNEKPDVDEDVKDLDEDCEKVTETQDPSDLIDDQGEKKENQSIADESENESDVKVEPDEKIPVKETVEDEKKKFIKNQLEAILFVSDNPISAEDISVKLGLSKKVIEEMLNELAIDYLERSTSLEIASAGGKYIMQIKPEFTEHVKKFASGGLIREAIMRTLTIIAAKQPIMQSQLSKIRSGAGEHIKELEQMGLIKRFKKGRSFELITTEKFADMFGFSRDISKMKEQIKIYLMQKEDK